MWWGEVFAISDCLVFQVIAMKCYKSCILLLLFIVLSAVILERRSRHTTAAIQETSPTMLDSSGHDQDTINILKVALYNRIV